MNERVGVGGVRYMAGELRRISMRRDNDAPEDLGEIGRIDPVRKGTA
jgi:hypothetical protein